MRIAGNTHLDSRVLVAALTAASTQIDSDADSSTMLELRAAPRARGTLPNNR